MTEIKIKELFEHIPEPLKPLLNEVEEIWTVLPRLQGFLKSLIKPGFHGIKIGEVYLDPDVYVGKNTIIEHGAMIKGPAYIGANCQIRQGAYLRGNTYIDDHSIIGHAVEVKNSVIMTKTHCGHFNYVGDSLLGSRVNLGAGAILANLRFDHKTIKINSLDTGLSKFGALLGDGCQLGSNTVLNPGTIFKKNLNYSGKPLKSGVYDQTSLQKAIK
ncbi:MAG: hypothetical protein GF332_04685 [Candidatus Moranbacteria bacterium]|nr:hypothetical protein [Candidatus Moranbacteria bacterium]